MRQQGHVLPLRCIRLRAVKSSKTLLTAMHPPVNQGLDSLCCASDQVRQRRFPPRSMPRARPASLLGPCPSPSRRLRPLPRRPRPPGEDCQPTSSSYLILPLRTCEEAMLQALSSASLRMGVPELALAVAYTQAFDGDNLLNLHTLAMSLPYRCAVPACSPPPVAAPPPPTPAPIIPVAQVYLLAFSSSQ